MPSNPLTNFEIQEYYQNKPIFNGFYSRDNSLKKIKDGTYIIKFEYADVGTHCIALYVANINIIYFDSFGVEQVPKETEIFIGHRNKHIQNRIK